MENQRQNQNAKGTTNTKRESNDIYSGIEAVIQVSAPTRISNMVSVAKRNNYTRDQAPHRLNANCWCICAPL